MRMRKKAFSSGKIMIPSLISSLIGLGQAQPRSRPATLPRFRVKGQQEMVGFVLIVVIVIVGMFVFLMFSFGQDDVSENVIVNNVLSAIMKTSSDCAMVYEPNYDDMRDLFRSCYEGRRCANTLEMACDTLEESLRSILDEVLVLEPVINAYQLDFSVSDDEGILGIFKLVEGNCTGNIYGSEPVSIRVTGDENLRVSLRVCMESLEE